MPRKRNLRAASRRFEMMVGAPLPPEHYKGQGGEKSTVAAVFYLRKDKKSGDVKVVCHSSPEAGVV